MQMGSAVSTEEFSTIVRTYESECKGMSDEDAFVHLKGKLSSVEKYASMSSSSSFLAEAVSEPPVKIARKCDHADVHTVVEVGDVVKVFFEGFWSEGVVVELIGDLFSVDFGDTYHEFEKADCHLVMRGVDFEVGDFVDVQVGGSCLFFRGKIINLNLEKAGTFDVLMDGDDPNDIERGVSVEQMRKLMTSRPLAIERWKKVLNSIRAIQAFAHFGHFHSVPKAKLELPPSAGV